MSENWRLFIAIGLPVVVRRQIEQTQRDLERRIPQKAVRWVTPGNIHLTLKFLGDVDVAQIDAIQDALARAASPHPAFALRTAGLGCFPNSQNPRVLWLGVAGAVDALRALQVDVETAIASLGFEPDGRAFSPHLTLARVQRDANRNDAAKVGEAAEQGSNLPELEWPVNSVSLMRSQLKPSGSVYTELHQVSLPGD